LQEQRASNENTPLGSPRIHDGSGWKKRQMLASKQASIDDGMVSWCLLALSLYLSLLYHHKTNSSHGFHNVPISPNWRYENSRWVCGN
jgi:hypothetical protein